MFHVKHGEANAMTQQRERRLGRGLDSLIGGRGDAPAVAGDRKQLEKVPLDLLDPNPWQPRTEFPAAELEELIRSIEKHGVLQPIVVRRAGHRYQIVAGERRWRASQELGTGTIDAVVIEAHDRDMLEWSIIENAQRSDLNPIDLAVALKRLIDEFHLTQEEVGERVGQSRSHVANTLRLLDLPTEIRAMVSRGTVSAGAGRALLSIRSQTDRLRLAKDVEEGRLNVRQLEARAAGSNRATTDVHAKKADPNLTEVAEEIQAALALKVRISGTPRRGAVTVAYHTPSELARIHKLLVAADELSAAKTGEEADSLPV
jgi:ParB family transcriptional regulator, chromosome partitioning protein